MLSAWARPESFGKYTHNTKMLEELVLMVIPHNELHINENSTGLIITSKHFLQIMAHPPEGLPGSILAQASTHDTEISKKSLA